VEGKEFQTRQIVVYFLKYKEKRIRLDHAIGNKILGETEGNRKLPSEPGGREKQTAGSDLENLGKGKRFTGEKRDKRSLSCPSGVEVARKTCLGLCGAGGG